jgi:TonB family protein
MDGLPTQRECEVSKLYGEGRDMRIVAISAICLLFGVSAAEAQDTSAPSASAEIHRQRDWPNCDAYYPPSSTATGTTAVGFSVTSRGDISDIDVVQSSGRSNLDAAALKCVTNARLIWDVRNQRVIKGGLVAQGSASVKWVHDGHSTLFVGCPYPTMAVRLQEQGAITVSFRVLNDGTVANPTVAKSSGFVDLDNAALSCAATYRYISISNGGAPVEPVGQVVLKFGLVD